MSNRNEIYTPITCVKLMLDEIGYNSSEKIFNKNIIDNSCGDGAFLTEIVKRYIYYSKLYNKAEEQIIEELEKYIYGVDISEKSIKKTKENLNLIVTEELEISQEIKWNLISADSTQLTKFNNKMDYVVGNPPYVRIHNMKDINYKKFQFTKKGMVDLYLIFFELGINMLNETGQLIYITPNSYFTTKSGKIFREYIIKNELLKKIINFEHTLVFSGVQTYTAITYLSKKQKTKNLIYQDFTSGINKSKNYKDIVFADNIFVFNEINSEVKNIINFTLINKNIIVRNGFATNANDIFIKNFDNSFKKSFILLDSIKIRKKNNEKFTRKKAIFPYWEKKIMTLEEIGKIDSQILNYIQFNKEKLLNRKIDDNQKWWEYSRTQGINDLNKPKIIISNIFKNEEQIYLEIVEPNIIVYGSGYYICVTDNQYKLKFIYDIIIKNKIIFMEYLKTLNKNKGSQYYFYTSKDLQKFISYLIFEYEKKTISTYNKKNEITNIIDLDI